MSAAALGVGSLWFNMEALLARTLPGRWPQILLGVSGGAGAYGDGPLAEFELSPQLGGHLRGRSGIDLEERTDGPGQPRLRAWLAGGRSAIVAVDSFHLPYRPAFGRVHSGRTILVGPSDSPGTVAVEDRWPPCWGGEIALAALEPARASLVPIDCRLEPVFAGSACSFRWWSLAAPAAPPRNPAAWLAARLGDLADDDPAPGAGASLLRTMARQPGGTPGETRRSSLILRAELSPKVYGLGLMTAAAALLGDALLAEALPGWRAALGRLAYARDLLIKQTAFPSPLHLRLVEENLLAAAVAQERLAGLLISYHVPRPAGARYA